MFSFGQDKEEDENTPFFEPCKEKSTFFGCINDESESPKPNAFNLFNDNKTSRSKKCSGKKHLLSSKRTIIDGLDFNRKESVSIL